MSSNPKPFMKESVEGKFRETELKQVEATAVTIGILALRAKKNLELKGVGRKFSGIYYCHSFCYSIGASGYSCEIKLKKNALGKGAGDKSAQTKGKSNEKEALATSQNKPPAMVTINADSGVVS